MIVHPERLNGVHPDLVRVIQRCAQSYDFMLIQGLRTVEEERENVAKGASTTMHSRHLPGQAGFACAVDLGALTTDGAGIEHLTWEVSAYAPLAQHMKAAAAQENVPIEWGGDWQNFRDYGHFQLPWSKYP